MYFLIGGAVCGIAVGSSATWLYLRSRTIAIADVKMWHTKLNDIATADAERVRTIAGVIRNDISGVLRSLGKITKEV
jgi:hypothetical protein